MPPYAAHQLSNIEPLNEASISEEQRKKIGDVSTEGDGSKNRENNMSYLAKINNSIKEAFTFKTTLKWENAISICLVHIVSAIGAIVLWDQGQIKTIAFGFFMGGLAGFGVTAGAHRLWCHRSYKATLPLRIILIICYSAAGQNTMFDWVRDHRVHHKYSETDADPHNSNRGFFFSHVGWLMMRKHPEVIEKGKIVDMSDVVGDPVIKFHQKYFTVMKAICCFIIPVAVPMYCWNEQFVNAVVSQVMMRYIIGLNFTWFVNSWAHISGGKPYNRFISPVDNGLVSFLAMGEGWHNYHHAFPWDYKASELGGYSLNLTTFLLDMFAKIGWAYDLRTPSKDLVVKTILKSGDGSHPEFGHLEVSPDEDGKSIEKEY